MENYLVGIDSGSKVFIAHASWKKSEKEVYWPPQGTRDIQRLIKVGQTPALNWDVYDCQWTKFSSNDYKKALEYQSLKINHKTESSAESDYAPPSMHQTWSGNNILDFNSICDEFVSAESAASVEESLKSKSIENAHSLQGPAVQQVLAPSKDASIGDCRSEMTNTPNEATSTTAGTMACQCNAVWFPAIQMTLDMLHGDVKKIAAAMEALSIKVNNKEGAQSDNLLPIFPIVTHEAFDNFNIELARVEVRNQLVNKLQRVGGKSPRDAVRHAVAMVIGGNVVSLFTWHGLRGKDALKTTQVGKCLIESFANKEMTEHNVGVIIGDWLRHEADKFKKQQY